MYFYNYKSNNSFSTKNASSTSIFIQQQQQQQQQLWSNATNSSTSPPESECHFPIRIKIFFCLVNVFVFILSIVTNFLFCRAYFKRPKLRQSSPMVLLVNLSIIDMFISLCIPFFLFTYTAFFPNWPLGLIGTDLFNAIWSFAVVAPFTTVTAIALERYCFIKRREFHKSHCTPRKMKYLVLIIWIYSMGWVAGIASSFTHVENVDRYHWNTNHILYYIFFSINVLVPLVIIPILYCRSLRHIKWMRECTFSLELDETTSLLDNREMEDREKAFTNSMIKVVFTLFIIWVPIFIVEFFYTEFNDECVVKIIDLINTFLSINCFLNPIIYSYGNQEVSAHLKDLKNRVFNSSRRSPNDPIPLEDP